MFNQAAYSLEKVDGPLHQILPTSKLAYVMLDCGSVRNHFFSNGPRCSSGMLFVYTFLCGNSLTLGGIVIVMQDRRCGTTGRIEVLVGRAGRA